MNRNVLSDEWTQDTPEHEADPVERVQQSSVALRKLQRTLHGEGKDEFTVGSLSPDHQHVVQKDEHEHLNTECSAPTSTRAWV